MDNTFKAHNRLGKDTSKIIKNGQRVISDNIVMYYLKQDNPKITAVVGRKVGKSVKRNKLKKWTREIFRSNKNNLYNFGIVIIYKPGSAGLDFNTINDKLINLWIKQGLLKH